MAKMPGFSFSWKRALGITQVKTRFARKIGISTSKQGWERKIGHSLVKILFQDK